MIVYYNTKTKEKPVANATLVRHSWIFQDWKPEDEQEWVERWLWQTEIK